MCASHFLFHTAQFSVFALRSTTDRKRLKADMIASPARMLDARALAAACSATRTLAQAIARRLCAPPDDGNGTGKRRMVLAALTPKPDPGRRSLQLAEGRSWSGFTHDQIPPLTGSDGQAPL